MFAKEVDGISEIKHAGLIQRRQIHEISYIYIGTIGNQEFDNLPMAKSGCVLQSSHSKSRIFIHIYARG